MCLESRVRWLVEVIDLGTDIFDLSTPTLVTSFLGFRAVPLAMVG
jgi:hypothetical protein